jgi:chromosomal replication initiation ATPase DnaA
MDFFACASYVEAPTVQGTRQQSALDFRSVHRHPCVRTFGGSCEKLAFEAADQQALSACFNRLYAGSKILLSADGYPNRVHGCSPQLRTEPTRSLQLFLLIT